MKEVMVFIHCKDLYNHASKETYMQGRQVADDSLMNLATKGIKDERTNEPLVTFEDEIEEKNENDFDKSEENVDENDIHAGNSSNLEPTKKRGRPKKEEGF